ncbi:hypothetical protein CYMTET_14509, partial [Cymbomonas tetramitiformis]
MQYGGRCLDSFVKTMEALQEHFAPRKRQVIDVLKEIQKSTRQLQVVVGEGKTRQCGPLTAKVPGVKRSLERFVFQVKLLTHNSDAGNLFWMGNLKHKDLQGHEISSQVPRDEEEDEDELMEDEDGGEDDGEEHQGAP